MNTKEQVIEHCENSYKKGKGVRLTHEQLGMLFAIPETPDDERVHQSKKIFDVPTRWLIRRDIPEVLRIEQENFEFPWTKEEFVQCLRQKNCLGIVAEHEAEIVGYMIYELHKSRLDLLNLAVEKSLHRHSIGTQLIDRLKDKLSQSKRTSLRVEVRETNLAAQCFLRDLGFKVSKVFSDHYEETDEDCYLMQWEVRCAAQ